MGEKLPRQREQAVHILREEQVCDQMKDEAKQATAGNWEGSVVGYSCKLTGQLHAYTYTNLYIIRPQSQRNSVSLIVERMAGRVS